MEKTNWQSSINRVVIFTFTFHLLICYMLVSEVAKNITEEGAVWLVGVLIGIWIGIRLIVHYIALNKSKGPSISSEISPSDSEQLTKPSSLKVPEIFCKYWRNWAYFAIIFSIVLAIVIPGGFLFLFLSVLEFFTFYYIKKWKPSKKVEISQDAHISSEMISTLDPSSAGEKVEGDFFPAKWFRTSTLKSIVILLAMGVLALISEIRDNPEKLPNFWNESWAGLNFIFIGVGEIAVIVIIQAVWNGKTQSQRSNWKILGVPLIIVGLTSILLLVIFDRFEQFINIITHLQTYQIMGIVTLSIFLVLGLYVVMKKNSLQTALGYVFLGFIFSMVMEFCVDYGAYGIYPWRNGEMVQIVMLGLSLHYFAFVAIFRIWYKFFDFTPKEAYLAMGTTGFILEFFLLPMIYGSFEIGLFLLFPLYYFINALNYGSFVLIPTLYHQKSGSKKLRPSSPTISKTLLKYLVSIGGTLLLGMFEIIFFYDILFGLI